MGNHVQNDYKSNLSLQMIEIDPSSTYISKIVSSRYCHYANLEETHC